MALIALIAALWCWKALEIGGRKAHLLRRNLGWGYVVDLSTPLVATGVAALFFVVRRIVSLKA